VEHNGSYWAVAHNNNRQSELWQLSLDDLTLVERHVMPANWAHNVLFAENSVLVCDSKNGTLIDQVSGEVVWEAGEPNVITRGLAATETHLYIGRSEYGNRYSRRFSNGGYWIVNRKTMRTENRVLLKGTGCVNELRLIGVTDEAHKFAPELKIDRLRASFTLEKLIWLRKNWTVVGLRIKYFMVMKIVGKVLAPPYRLLRKWWEDIRRR
jgi:hypothetical protein